MVPRRSLALVLALALAAAACGDDLDDAAEGASTAAAEAPTTRTAPSVDGSNDSGADDEEVSVSDPPPETAGEQAAAAPAEIDEAYLVEQAKKSWDEDQPGAVMVAVFDADGTSVHGSVGTDPSGSTPTLDDAFRVGSITKTLTAITVLSLVDEGLIDLDAPVSDYVSRFEIDAAVTVRDALQHTGGLEDPTGFLTMIADDRSRVWSPDEVLATTNLDDLDSDGRHAYANVNYVVLGVVIEEVTGQPYHEVVRERITDPLDMTGTFLAYHEQGPEVFGGYYDVFGESGFSGTPEPIDFDFTSVETHAWASGAMVSTARDLHVLLSSLVGGSIIAPSLVSEMIPDDGYGFGLYVPEWTTETPLIGHDGRIPGSGTWLIHAPVTGATVFTVANGDHLRVSPATAEVAEAIGVRGFRIATD